MDNKTKWIEHVEGEKEYFSTPPEPFNNWQRNSKPEWLAERNLQNALSIVYGNWNYRFAKPFLEASIEVVDRAFAEDRFHAQYAEYGLPRNIGLALRVRAYAKAIQGESLDTGGLRQASANYIEWCSDLKGSDWDSIAQSDYLAGVKMSLLAGDIEQAQLLLQTKRKFKWHAEEYGLLVDLTREATSGIPIQNPDLSTRVTAFFDHIRDFDFKADVYFEVDLARLEWGALIKKYFVTGREIDWHRVIESISH